MFALVKFYKACYAAGIKPIGGCDLWISAPEDPRPWRLTLLCQNRDGYLNLSRLVSRAWQEGQHGGRALVDAGWLGADASHGQHGSASCRDRVCQYVSNSVVALHSKKKS